MKRLLVILAVLGLGGCGGFDAGYDCEQTLACEDNESDAALELCTDVSDALYDNATDAQKEQIDELYDKCKKKKGCAYVECIQGTMVASGG